MFEGVLDKGCTTLLVPDKDGSCQILAHTEDGPFEAENNMYLVEVMIPGTEEYQEEHFIGLSYPGSLVGRAMGLNVKEGFVWSMNAVTPRVKHSGIRRLMIVNVR